MKKLLLILLMGAINKYAFTQNIDYYPPKKDNVDQSAYNYGITILENTYEHIKNNEGKVDHIDYWNLAIAYTTLKEPNVKLVKQFLKMTERMNPSEYAFYITQLSKDKNPFKGYLSDEEFKIIYEESLKLVNSQEKHSKLTEIDDSNSSINKELARLMIELNEQDQKYRGGDNYDSDKQAEIDKRNLEIIDSLYQEYKTYIGKSIVGENLDFVMWEIIQHSNLKSMEFYLPVLKKAVNEGELPLDCYKLTVDRILAIKHNYQLFGGQIGVKMAPSSTIDSLKRRYGINNKTKKQNSSNIDDFFNSN